MRFKFIILLLITLGLSSCGSWTKQDKDIFIESCQKTKFNDAYCDCALEKAIKKYSSFDEMTVSEEEMALLLLDCIESDRKKEENK